MYQIDPRLTTPGSLQGFRLCIDCKSNRIFAGTQREYMGVLSLQPALHHLKEIVDKGTKFKLCELESLLTHLIVLCSSLSTGGEKEVAGQQLTKLGEELEKRVIVLLYAESTKTKGPDWEYWSEKAICDLLVRIDRIKMSLRNYRSPKPDEDLDYWKNELLMGWIERRYDENHGAIGKIMDGFLSTGARFIQDLAGAATLDEQTRKAFVEWRATAPNLVLYTDPKIRTYVANLIVNTPRYQLRIQELEKRGEQIVADKFRGWEEATSGRAAQIARESLEKKLAASAPPNREVKTQLIQEILPKLCNQIKRLGELLKVLQTADPTTCRIIAPQKVQAIQGCLIRLEGLFGRGIQPFLTGPEVERLLIEGGDLPDSLKHCIYYWVWKILAPKDNQDPEFGKNNFKPAMLKGREREIADLWIERAFEQYVRNMIEQGPEMIRVLNELSDLSVRDTAGFTASEEFANAIRRLEILGLDNPKINFNPYAIGFQFVTSRFAMPLEEMIKRTGERRLLDFYQGLKQAAARANLIV